MEVAESCTAAPYIQYIKKKKKNTLDKLKLNSNYSKKTSNLDLKKNTNSYFISIFNLTWLLFQSQMIRCRKCVQERILTFVSICSFTANHHSVASGNDLTDSIVSNDDSLNTALPYVEYWEPKYKPSSTHAYHYLEYINTILHGILRNRTEIIKQDAQPSVYLQTNTMHGV